MSSDEERQHYHSHQNGSDDDGGNGYGFDTNPQNGYYRYRDESSSSEEEPDRHGNVEKELSGPANEFEPIESYQKKNKDGALSNNGQAFGRSTSNKHGYDREVDEGDIESKLVCHAPAGWPMPKQKPEYDADDEDDTPPPEDPFVSSFEIVSEDQRGLIDQHRFIAKHYDEKEQDKYLSRAAERQFQESRDDDFDVISFATNDAHSLVEVNARNLNVDIHWRDGKRPGNGADKEVIAMAMSQHLRAHGKQE